MNNKRIFFFLNHPAHYHLFKNSINHCIKNDFDVQVGIVSKDVLVDLVSKESWNVVNLFPEGRRHKELPVLLNAMYQLIRTESRLLKHIKQIKPDLIIATEGTAAHAGWLKGIPSYIFNEDDTKATPENYLFYPFATKLILPEFCDRKKWRKKRTSYYGFHELAYLHPNYFTPQEDKAAELIQSSKRYFILRLAELTASHDAGKKGIGNEFAFDIIQHLEKYGRVYISAERELPEEFVQYRLNIPKEDMLHAIAFADLYIGDSQTMAAEAAILGVPSIRFNDFVGKLSYLDELEKKYELTFGVKTSNKDKVFELIDELLSAHNTKMRWQNKRKVLLIQTQNPTEIAIGLIHTFFDQNQKSIHEPASHR